MLSGARFRAYPTAAQAAILRQWIGHQRFIYNSKVREKEYWDRFARRSLALTGLKPLPDQAYSQFIGEETQFLRDVPAQILRNGAYRFASGCARALKGLGGSLTIRKKYGRQSVLVTSELFRFHEYVDTEIDQVRRHLMLGTKKHHLGRLKFNAHQPSELPKMLSISQEADGRRFVSFCYEKPLVDEDGVPVVLRTPEELAYEYGLRDDLEAITVGLDRGTKLPLATSDGQSFVVDAKCQKRIDSKERRARRYQRRMAWQQKGSKRRAKTKRRIARLKAYGRNVRSTARAQ